MSDMPFKYTLVFLAGLERVFILETLSKEDKIYEKFEGKYF